MSAPAAGSTGPVRVLVADDQPLIRSAISDLVGQEPDLEMVGECADGAAAVAAVRRERPDVVLMDIRMPGMDGIEATRLICADPDAAGTRVVILTTFEEDDLVARALHAGASAFVGKGADPGYVVDAIRTVHEGDSLLSPAATRALVSRFRRFPVRDPELWALREGRLATLTARELEVLTSVGAGLSNDEIAQQLVISAHTAKTHVNRTMTKLGVHDRAQLVIVAYEHGFVASGWVRSDVDISPEPCGLDAKDSQILAGLSGGRSIALIARECGLSSRQVSRRIAAMSERLGGAANATQLVYLAVRRGLLWPVRRAFGAPR